MKRRDAERGICRFLKRALRIDEDGVRKGKRKKERRESRGNVPNPRRWRTTDDQTTRIRRNEPPSQTADLILRVADRGESEGDDGNDDGVGGKVDEDCCSSSTGRRGRKGSRGRTEERRTGRGNRKMSGKEKQKLALLPSKRLRDTLDALPNATHNAINPVELRKRSKNGALDVGTLSPLVSPA
jgi:hypothetical protein